MTLLEQLKKKTEDRKKEFIEKGIQDWPKKFLDDLDTRAINFYNTLELEGNYYYLNGVGQAAQKEGFGAIFATASLDKNCNATLIISWK